MEKTMARLDKLSWAEVRNAAHGVNPELADIIDELNPGKTHWLAKAIYPYGSLAMNKSVLMLPNPQGKIVSITDESLDPSLREELGYNLNSNPVSLVLKNTFEIYLPLEDRTIPLSGLIAPGTAFGAWRVLNPHKAEHPAFIWDMTAGARSVFMLPKITEAKKHHVLTKKYGVTADVPRSLMGHFEVFKQLSECPLFNPQWDAEILYFPHVWFTHLEENKWARFYKYFQNAAWGGSEFWRNLPIHNLIFSLILKDYESRPSAYIMDTAKYLINMAMGALPGLAPARSNLAGPFDSIQRIYTKEYELDYPPIILQPELFNMRDPKSHPVYYSLQFPNALEFKPNTRARISLISDLHEIRSLMVRYERELLSGRFNIGGTSLEDVFKYTKFDYFHSHVDLHSGMRDSFEMFDEDPFLSTTLNGVAHNNYPEKVPFLHGCIRLAHKV